MNDDESSIRRLFQQLIDGWNREDAAGFAAVFTEDAIFIAFDGTELAGRSGVEAFHAPLFATHLKGMRLFGRIDKLHFLAHGVALVHATGSTSQPGGQDPVAQRDSVQTLIAVREAGGWRFTAFQNTRVRPMGAGAGFLAWMLADGAWKLLGGRRQSRLLASTNRAARLVVGRSAFPRAASR